MIIFELTYLVKLLQTRVKFQIQKVLSLQQHQEQQLHPFKIRSLEKHQQLRLTKKENQMSSNNLRLESPSINRQNNPVTYVSSHSIRQNASNMQIMQQGVVSMQNIGSQRAIPQNINVHISSPKNPIKPNTNQMKSSIKQEMFPQSQAVTKPTRDSSAQNRSKSILSNKSQKRQTSIKQNQRFVGQNFTNQNSNTNFKSPQEEKKSEYYNSKEQLRQANYGNYQRQQYYGDHDQQSRIRNSGQQYRNSRSPLAQQSNEYEQNSKQLSQRQKSNQKSKQSFNSYKKNFFANIRNDNKSTMARQPQIKNRISLNLQSPSNRQSERAASENIVIQRQVMDERQEQYEIQRQSNIVYNSQMRYLGKIFGDENMEFQKIKQNIENVILNSGIQRDSEKSRLSKQLVNKSQSRQKISIRIDNRKETVNQSQNKSGKFGVTASIDQNQNVRRSNMRQAQQYEHSNILERNSFQNLQLSIRLAERLKAAQQQLSRRIQIQQGFTSYKSIGISYNFDKNLNQESKNSQHKQSHFKNQKRQMNDLQNQHYIHYEQNGFSPYMESVKTIGSNAQKTSQKDSISKLQIQNPNSDSPNASQSRFQVQKQHSHNMEPIYNVVEPNSKVNTKQNYGNVNQSSQSHKDQSSNKQIKNLIIPKASVSQNQLSLSQNIQQSNPKKFSSSEQAVLTILGSDHPVFKSIHQYNEFQQNLQNQNQFSYREENQIEKNLTKKHYEFFQYYANPNVNRQNQHEKSQISKNHVKSPKNSITSEQGEINIGQQINFKKGGVYRSSDMNLNLNQSRGQLEQALKDKNVIIQQLTKQLNSERLKSQKSIALQKELQYLKEGSFKKIKSQQSFNSIQMNFEYAGSKVTPAQLLNLVKQKDILISQKSQLVKNQQQEINILRQKLIKIEELCRSLQSKLMIKSAVEQSVSSTIKNASQTYYKQECLKLQTELQSYKQNCIAEIKKNEQMVRKLAQIQKSVKNHEEHMYSRQGQLKQMHERDIRQINQKLIQQQRKLKQRQAYIQKYKEEIHTLQEKQKVLQQNQIRYRNAQSFIKAEIQNKFAEEIKSLHLQITDLHRLNEEYFHRESQNTINLQGKFHQIDVLKRKQQSMQEQLKQLRQRNVLDLLQKNNLIEEATKAGDNARIWVQKYNRLDAQLTNFKNQNLKIKQKLDQLDHQHSENSNKVSSSAQEELNAKLFSLSETVSTRDHQIVQYKRQLEREKELRLQIDREYQQKIKMERQQKIKLEKVYQQLKYELSKQTQSYKKVALEYSSFKEDYQKVASEYQNINSSHSIISQELSFKKQCYAQIESQIQKMRNQVHNLKTLLRERQRQNDQVKTQLRSKRDQQNKSRAQFQRQLAQVQEQMRKTQMDLQRRQNDFERVKQDFEKYRNRTQQLQEEKQKVKGSFNRRIQQKETTYQELLERAEQEKRIALNQQKSEAEYYKKMYEEISGRAKDLETSINRLKTQKIPTLQREHAQMVDEKIKSQRQISSFEDQIRDLQQQLKRLKNERIPNLQKTCQDYVFKAGTFQMKHRNLEIKNSELQQDLKYKNQSLIPELRNQIEQRKNRYFKLYDQMSQYRQQSQQLNSKLREKQIDYQQIKRLFEDKNSQLQEINQLRQQISRNFYELQSKYQERQNNINEISHKYREYEQQNGFLRQSKQKNQKQIEQIQEQLKNYRINLYEMEQQNKKNQIQFESFKQGMAQIFRNYDEIEKMQASSETKMKARQNLAKQLGQFLQVDLVRILLPIYSSNLKMELSNSLSQQSIKQSIKGEAQVQAQDQAKKSEFYNQKKQKQKHNYQNENSNTSFARGDHWQNRSRNSRSNNESNANYIQGKFAQVPYNATGDQKQRAFQRPVSNKKIKKQNQSQQINVARKNNQEHSQRSHIRNLSQDNYQINSVNTIVSSTRQVNSVSSTERPPHYQHFYQVNPAFNPSVPIIAEKPLHRVQSDQQFSFKKQSVPIINSITHQNQRSSLEHNIHNPIFDQSKSNGFHQTQNSQFKNTNGSVQSANSSNSRKNSLIRKQKIEIINPSSSQKNKIKRFTGEVNAAQMQSSPRNININMRNPSRLNGQMNSQNNSIEKSQGSKNSSRQEHPYYVSTDPKLSKQNNNRFTGVIDRSSGFVPTLKNELDMFSMSNNANRNIVFNRASGSSASSSAQSNKVQNEKGKNIYSGVIQRNSLVQRNSHQTMNSNPIEQVSQSQPSQILGSVTDSHDSGIHIFQRQNKDGGCCFGKQ